VVEVEQEFLRIIQEPWLVQEALVVAERQAQELQTLAVVVVDQGGQALDPTEVLLEFQLQAAQEL
jgi:hypothetical protein